MARFMVITGDKRLIRLMQATDVFEPGKVLGAVYNYDVCYKEDCELSLDVAAELINKIRELLLTIDTSRIVTLIHLEYIQIADEKIYNKEVIPYFNPEVRIVSVDGGFALFEDLLTMMGLHVETDQYRYVKNVSFSENPCSAH